MFKMRQFSYDPERRVELNIQSLIPVNTQGSIVFSSTPLAVKIVEEGDGGNRDEDAEVDAEAKAEAVKVEAEAEAEAAAGAKDFVDEGKASENLNLVFVYSFDPIQPSIYNSLACGIFMCVEPLTCREGKKKEIEC